MIELKFRVTVVAVGDLIESVNQPGEMTPGVYLSLDDVDTEPLVVTLPVTEKQAKSLGSRVLQEHTMKITIEEV